MLPSFELILNSGVSFPFNNFTSGHDEFSTYFNPGYSIGGGIGYNFNNNNYGLSIMAMYSSFPFDLKPASEENHLDEKLVSGIGTSIFTISAIWKVGGRFSPKSLGVFMTLGLGYSYYSGSTINLTYSTYYEPSYTEIQNIAAQSGFPFEIGFGFEAPINSFSAFVEGKLIFCFTRNQDEVFAPILAGFRYRL